MALLVNPAITAHHIVSTVKTAQKDVDPRFCGIFLPPLHFEQVFALFNVIFIGLLL